MSDPLRSWGSLGHAGSMQADTLPALLFPGQGTEAIGMSAGWDASEAWSQVLDTAERTSGFPLRRWMAEGPLETLRAPRHAPFSGMAHAVGVYKAHRASGMPSPRFVTGHSLGFFSALVAAEVVPLEAVMELVDTVEDLSDARFGTTTHGMAFFIGITELELRQALVDYPGLVLSNINGRAQFTVSGERPSLEALVSQLEPQVLKSGLLPLCHPLHGSHMVPLVPEVTRHLIRWSPRTPAFPVLSQTDGRWITSGEEAWDEAIASIGLPVCWLEVVKRFGPEPIDLFECGYGSQLANLTRWADRDRPVASLQDFSSLSHWTK